MKRIYIYFFVFSLLATNIAFSQGQVAEGETNAMPPVQRTYAPPLAPATYSLFGEEVPLNDVHVKESFERELLVNTYLQGSNLYILRLSTRWLPMISEKLKAANVPDDFKYLCIAESALQNLISKAGATGFWQFMSGTAPGYGLEVNSHVDERYNAEKSTDAAIKYLKSAYNKFGNWTAAAASYNCGMGGYNARVTQQGTAHYYDLWLPEETMRYIYRIMALKYIIENPQSAGFNIPPGTEFLPFKTKEISVDYAIPSLVKFAKENGTNYKTLRILNPWLRSTSLPNRSKKLYKIQVPEGS